MVSLVFSLISRRRTVLFACVLFPGCRDFFFRDVSAASVAADFFRGEGTLLSAAQEFCFLQANREAFF